MTVVLEPCQYNHWLMALFGASYLMMSELLDGESNEDQVLISVGVRLLPGIPKRMHGRGNHHSRKQDPH